MGACSSIEFVDGSRIYVVRSEGYNKRRGLKVGATGVVLSTFEAIGGPAANIRMDEEFFGGHSCVGRCEDGHGIVLLFEDIAHEAPKELPEFETTDADISCLFS